MSSRDSGLHWWIAADDVKQNKKSHLLYLCRQTSAATQIDEVNPRVIPRPPEYILSPRPPCLKKTPFVNETGFAKVPSGPQSASPPGQPATPRSGSGIRLTRGWSGADQGPLWDFVPGHAELELFILDCKNRRLPWFQKANLTRIN